MSYPKASTEHIDRILLLTRKLGDRVLLNTRASRADCRRFALGILELLDDDNHWHDEKAEQPRTADTSVIERLREAIAARQVAGERAELTRLFVMEALGDKR